VDFRQNKRYQLKTPVALSWKGTDGNENQGEGHTRDISSYAVFVLTSTRLPLGTSIQLEVSLPSLCNQRSGVCLRTYGKVIRSEEKGFAAVGDMGFRIQFRETRTSGQAVSETGNRGSSRPEARRKPVSVQLGGMVSRSLM